MLGTQLRPSNTFSARVFSAHRKLESRSRSTVTCAVDRAQATDLSNATASLAERADVVSLSVVTRPERSALEDLLEHRWKRCLLSVTSQMASVYHAGIVWLPSMLTCRLLNILLTMQRSCSLRDLFAEGPCNKRGRSNCSAPADPGEADA